MRHILSFKGALALSLLLAFFTSCSARIDITLLADGAAHSTVDVAFEDHFMRVLANLSGVSDEVIIDPQAINKALAQAPGISSSALVSESGAQLLGQVRAHDFNALFAHTGSERLRGLDAPASVEWCGVAKDKRRSGSVVFSLDRDNAPIFVSTLSPDIVDYLTALMAPLATGEEMDQIEYLDSIEALYGPGVAKEIREGSLTLSFSVPGKIAKASRGSYSGNKLIWELPLLDVLVLEAPLSLDFKWQ